MAVLSLMLLVLLVHNPVIKVVTVHPQILRRVDNCRSYVLVNLLLCLHLRAFRPCLGLLINFRLSPFHLRDRLWLQLGLVHVRL